MSKTYQELEAEQARENKEQELARLNNWLEKDLIDQWYAAWGQFSQACIKQMPADEAGQAVLSLVKMFRDNNLITILKKKRPPLFNSGRDCAPREHLQNIADAWQDRRGESCILALILDVYDNGPSATKIGTKITSSVILASDPGVVSDWVGNIKAAVRDGFSPLPKPETIKPPTPPKKQKTRKQKGPSIPELDKAIQIYVVENHALYERLKKAHVNNESQILKIAREKFGRNNLTRTMVAKFDVKISSSRISKTPTWLKIRDELGLGQKTGTGGPFAEEKAGIKIAEEKAGVARGDITVNAVITTELYDRINKQCPPEVAAEIIGKLELKDYSEADAELMLEAYQDHSEEDH